MERIMRSDRMKYVHSDIRGPLFVEAMGMQARGIDILAGGKPVFYVCDEKANWYPDITDIRSKITDRTKAIVIINPNNPTGMLYPKKILLEIIEVAREFGLLIFADEIYDRLVMDGLIHTSLASLAARVI